MTSTNKLMVPLVLLLALGSWGCDDDETLTPGSTASPGTGDEQVRVVDRAFEPGSISIGPGTTINFIHEGEETHTVTVNGENQSGDMAPGDSFSFEFDRVGEHRINCDYHPADMLLVVTVTGIE